MFINKVLNKKTPSALIDTNLKYYILNGALFAIMTSFSKSYAMKFLFRIGGSNFHISLFNALPGFIAVFATIPGIIWMCNTTHKKAVIGNFFLSSRIFIFFLAFVPFLPVPYQPLTFIILTSIMNFPEAISVTGLQSYSGDIFLPSERANAIALRNKFSALAQLLSLLLVGKILSLPGTTPKQIIYLYQLFFVVAFVIGLFEVQSFYKLKEKSCEVSKNNLTIKNTLSIIFKNKKFNSFLLCSILFHFGWQMGWPLFNIYQINYLGADEGWLTILNVTSTIIMFFSFNYWNKSIQKKGNSFVMAFATLGMALTPILFALSPNLWIMTITGLVTGFFTAGTVTVILSSLLEVAPEKDRMLYVGIHATLTNITLAIAPIIGNVVLSYSNIYIALVATALFRFVGSFAFFIRNHKKKEMLS